ncbi:iron transport multicopper oxidase [Geosmithia morbida]|uniref:Iron transport multicopper oxidase n=1 Tax=Geosmithia morbida TaxID=1094350 RepID=A0A9P4YUV3_9HYPO|nr:iron transport multicopper oxidase [Geosmithia morbida]KAF4122242.1 iron transport multicopper oxidase [Geosmithia morbida]
MARFSLKSITPALLLGGLFPAAPVNSKTIVHNFTVGWVTANPDGAFDRPTIGVNGQWPPPLITGAVGDHLSLTLRNDLGDASTSLHFHGFPQNGTTHMDGAVGVTQCAVPPGEVFTYEIQLQRPGTYWYHAHNDGQYPDGLRGPIVIQDPDGPYEDSYDDEIILTLSDWYHRPMKDLIKDFINVENPTGAEPVPQAALMNDTQGLQVKVLPGKTYLVRIVNMGAFAAHYLWFEGHQMRIVEVDGVWTEEAYADRLYITPAQRYSVLLTTKNSDSENFPIISAMDQELFDIIPEDFNPNVTGWLVYDDAEPLSPASFPDELDSFDDFDLVPYDGLEILDHVDHTIQLDVTMENLGDGANYAFFSDVTYVAPKVPSLYTALSVGTENASDPRPYGLYTIPHILEHGQVIEIVLNNEDDGKHPFHLHGHNFQLVHRSEPDAGAFKGDIVSISRAPVRRDTVYVEPNGNIVLRFRSDNPGIWLFHCHIEWHMDQGLVATFVEAPEMLQKLDIPKAHFDICHAAGVPTVGNAAGNTKDVFDMSGQNKPPKPLPAGFTPKGYIAMFFSSVAAIMGLTMLYWLVLFRILNGEISLLTYPQFSPS